MIKKIPCRTCVVTKEKLPKKELIRVIKTPEEEIVLDATGKKNGRGAYICHSLECFQKAKKSKAFERSLKMSIPIQVYDELEKELNGLERE